ncbi:xanthine dehydrogenase family protein subunit M [Brasilonema octagenarum UFV-E1]|uniref:Xanthine dehydrogenase family protein subunit M n=1 Tax=Brasilonema sennae CENA114 TaxID=415709 RepID=A0A856MJG0_9CYAN|nr:xanthine dehydrogenase family protein subunit M [Brasilonema sennae]QDL09277.1 xanthine dehydrogenase family protein subunit M [Brasilonema sennae CENA114]QDL15634.1 xanthine dehydrogenase family protein subunit M [Brasilonema octagenarum UFV-E1]
MQPFSYKKAGGADNAVALVSPQEQAAYLAGGTSLIDLMKLNVQTPQQLVDINPLPLSKIEMHNNGVRIGAMARNSDVAYDAMIRERYPVLSEALLSGASPQLRNMASVGGNLLQRTRCYYFRDTAFPCNKRVPGSGCPAIEGHNRIHAILGGSDRCIATHPSDMAVAMVALDAVVQIRGSKGERSVPLVDFHLLPGETPERETVLQHGELIVAVDLPGSPFARRSHYLKVRDRASYAFAMASVATALDIQNGIIRSARIALGGVGTKPWRAYAAEKLLVNKPANEATFQAAANAAVAGSKPQKYNGFKVELTKRTIVRALFTVGGMA